MDKVKRFRGILLICIVLININTFSGSGDIYNLDLEVVEEVGDWELTSPMFFNTTDYEDLVSLTVNATNLNATEKLVGFQYMRIDWEFLEFSDPSMTEYQEIENYLWLDFGTTNFNWTWNLRMYGDLIDTYNVRFNVYVEDTHLVSDLKTGEDKAESFVCHFWRSKSNQLIIQYHLGDGGEERYIYGGAIDSWDLANITYRWNSVVDREASFTVMYNDISYQSGSHEGIADPINNDNWGFFEPLRQILLFIMNLFMGLVGLILPQAIEDMFDDLIDNLSDLVNPAKEIFSFLIDNWLTLILVITGFLLVNGVEAASEGNYKEIVMPLWNFYTGIASFIFKIMGFIIRIISATISAIPFI